MEDQTRKYALDVICRVMMEDAYAAVLMRSSPLDPAHMPFVSQLVYTTLRNLTYLEEQWKPYVHGRIRPRIRYLLDMSAAELFLMDKVPVYAVISTSKELCSRYDARFVSAVIHQMASHGPIASADDLSHAAVNTSHPQWMIDMWKAHYGEERTMKILHADQRPARVYGRINTLKSSREELEQAGAVFVNDVSFTMPDNLLHSDLFRKGKCVIQDIHASQAAVLLDVRPGMSVLDGCAAPGTKTQETAMFMHNTGKIIAGEKYKARTHLIHELMERTGVSIVQEKVMDASVPGQFEEEMFDRILLDVPCSGLGDLKHKPEIRWHVKPENLDALVQVQREILEANAPYLKKEGILVYSTCTLNRKENEGMVKQFLKNHPEYELIEERTYFPYEDEGDGFYAAKLRKHGRKIMVE